MASEFDHHPCYPSSPSTGGFVQTLSIRFRVSQWLSALLPSRVCIEFFFCFVRTGSGKEETKEELVRLGVQLSLSVVEAMFLLCDDIHTMLSFCFKLWRLPVPALSPVSERLIRVIHNVNSAYIKPKMRVYQDGGNSVQFELIKTTWEDFANGIVVLHRLVSLLRRKDCSFFDDRLLSSAVSKYKQVLKKLDDKLRSAKDFSEANGFAARDTTNMIYGVWKSLFDEEGEGAGPEIRIFDDLFQPVVGKSWRSYADPKMRETTPLELPVWGHRGVHELPICPVYILRKDFPKEELKEEVVKLGVELSLYVAESMFLLCDDIRSVLLFCNKLAIISLNPAGPVIHKLLRGMYHVYTKHIKPKHGGVYRGNGGRSAQWRLTRRTWEDFDAGTKDLDLLVWILRGEGRSYVDGRELTSRVEKAFKEIEEKLRRGKEDDVSGYARDAAVEANMWDLWKSVFDKETEEAAETAKVMRLGMIFDMFSPLCEERVAKRNHLISSE